MSWTDALYFFAAFIITFSAFYLFFAMLNARRKHKATVNATIHEIQENIEIWDKWSYDLFRKEFVFFTCWYIGEDGIQLYKPKAWYNANFATFIEIVKRKDNLNNYTLHTSWH